MGEIEAQLKMFQKELSTGTMSLVLLAVLGQAPEPLYGYLIAKRLGQLGEDVIAGKQSVLYPVLRNLEGAGLLDSITAHPLQRRGGLQPRYLAKNVRTCG